MHTRREFLAGAATAGLATTIGSLSVLRPVPAAAQFSSARLADDWDAGQVTHLLPTVSHERMLIKVSLKQPLATSPLLHLGPRRVRGQKTDTHVEFWQFDAQGLAPATTYRLSLWSGDHGRSLCG